MHIHNICLKNINVCTNLLSVYIQKYITKHRNMKMVVNIEPLLQDVHTIVVISNLRPLRDKRYFYFTNDLMVLKNKTLWESYIYLPVVSLQRLIKIWRAASTFIVIPSARNHYKCLYIWAHLIPTVMLCGCHCFPICHRWGGEVCDYTASKLQGKDSKPVFSFHTVHEVAIPSLDFYCLDSIYDYQNL